MALEVRADVVWAGDISDQPGGLAEVLGALAAGGANLEFVIARRRAEMPGQGVVFVAPVKGKAVQNAAAKVGLSKAENVPTLRVEGADRPGMGEKMLRAIADQGINLRGVSGGVIGRRFVAYLGFDKPEDASNAAKALKKIDGAKPAGKKMKKGKKAR